MSEPFISRAFFEESPETVAKGLLGRILYVSIREGDIKRAQIQSVEAFNGETKRTSEGVRYAPGLVSISYKMNNCLLDIATGSEGASSNITLRGGYQMIDDVLTKIKGPGNLCKALGITNNNRECYEKRAVDGNFIWIAGLPVGPDQIKQKDGKSTNSKGIFYF